MAQTVKEITVETEGGQPVTVEVVAFGNLESNYGADADGNRGISMWVVDRFEFDIPDLDDRGNPLSFAAKKEVDTLVTIEAEQTNWNFRGC